MLRTPVRRSAWLSSATGADVYLKLETLQPTFSFKIRGAWNAVLSLAERGLAPDLVTASAGNHGRALAHAAAGAGLRLVAYVPRDAPRIKVEAIRASGADVRTTETYDDAERQAQQHARHAGAMYVSPYSHPDVIAGAGTIGLELLEDVPGLQTVVVPLGGGGLISGIAITMDGRETGVTGVEAEASTPFTRSVAAGRVVPIDVAPTLADGLAGNLDPESVTFGIVRTLVREIRVVSEGAIRSAIRDTLREERLVIEGAAATGVAALLQRGAGTRPLEGQRVAVVLSGANIDAEALRRII